MSVRGGRRDPHPTAFRSSAGKILQVLHFLVEMQLDLAGIKLPQNALDTPLNRGMVRAVAVIQQRPVMRWATVA